jgi:hypothetical protein
MANDPDPTDRFVTSIRWGGAALLLAGLLFITGVF